MAITKERIDAIYAEISKYKIELAPDPTVLGTKYLQDLIATCRNYTNHIARIMNELHREKMTHDFDLRRKETAFSIASDELLSSNPQVKNLPNIADRQAQINILLRDEHRVIENLKNDIKDLEHTEKLVRLIHRELKDTMGEIKVQRALVRDELDTGRMYGDERHSASDVANGHISGGYARPDDIDENELAKILSGEVTLPAETVEAAEPSTPEVVEVVEVSAEDTIEALADVLAESVPVGASPRASEPEVAVVTSTPEPSKKEAPPATAAKSTDEEQVQAFLSKTPMVAPSDVIQSVSSSISDQEFSDLFDSL